VAVAGAGVAVAGVAVADAGVAVAGGGALTVGAPQAASRAISSTMSMDDARRPIMAPPADSLSATLYHSYHTATRRPGIARAIIQEPYIRKKP
jgi:hypothetical protein